MGSFSSLNNLITMVWFMKKKQTCAAILTNKCKNNRKFSKDSPRIDNWQCPHCSELYGLTLWGKLQRLVGEEGTVGEELYGGDQVRTTYIATLEQTLKNRAYQKLPKTKPAIIKKTRRVTAAQVEAQEALARKDQRQLREKSALQILDHINHIENLEKVKRSKSSNGLRAKFNQASKQAKRTAPKDSYNQVAMTTTDENNYAGVAMTTTDENDYAGVARTTTDEYDYAGFGKTIKWESPEDSDVQEVRRLAAEDSSISILLMFFLAVLFMGYFIFRFFKKRSESKPNDRLVFDTEAQQWVSANGEDSMSY